jgi:hypothetical protein
VDFSLQGGRGIYANNFNIENVINNLSKDANGDGMHDKALIMNKGSSMQAKFDFGNSAVDKDKFIIVALDTGDDIAISTMLNNIQNSYDGAVNVNNGKVFLLYELPEDGTWAKIYKGSYNMDDVTLTYYDNNPLSGSIFDRTWVLAPDASDSAYLSIQKCQSNCDGFTPRGNELSVAANDLANYINRSFKPNNQTLNEIILTTRLKGIQNRNQFIRALENLSPHLILNGLQRQMAANTIMSGVVNVNRRLTYYKNYRYGAIYGEFNIPTNSDVKYYNDYYSAPFSQNNFWYEFFAGKMKQNEYEKIYGYDNNYYGFSLGYDIKPTNSFLIGGSYTFNYMDAKEDDKNASTIKAFTQLADIHVMNYSRHHWITVGIGGGLGYNHSYRNVDLIRSVSKASADFFNQYYYGRAEAGLNFILFESKPKEMLDTIAVNEAGEQRILHRINTGVKGMKTKQLGNMNDYIMLAPRISIQKDLYKFNKFTEKGDSGVNLSYDMEDINKLDASFGADLIFSGALSKQSALQFIFNYTLTKKLHDDVGVVNACLVDSPDGCFKWYAGNTQDIISDYGLKIMWHRYEQSTLSFGYTYSVAEKFYGHHISFNTSLSF